ncbi:MAG: hypothetical protein A2046_14930 [Bacteroidetes bacterium GWA2_30_7]|nr:MAG: hypothetical protein A2046_14930 [Bacteroidetes bacterium GWA2_30_7]
MLLRLFKSPQTIIIIFIPIIGILLWIKSFQAIDTHPFPVYQMPLYSLFASFLEQSIIISNIIAIVLLLFQAFLLNIINSKYGFISKRSYLPALIFLLLTSSINEIKYFQPIIFSNFFILFALVQIFDTYKIEKIFSNFFNSGFLISTASLFYFNSIYFIVIVWIGLLIIRDFKFREWIITFLGLITPYLISFELYFIFDNVENLLFNIKQNVLFEKVLFKYNTYDIIFFSYIVFITAISIFYLILIFNTQKISTRHYYLTFIFFVILIIGLFIISPSASIELIYTISIPITFILSNYLVNSNSIIFTEILFTLLLVMIGFLQFLS